MSTSEQYVEALLIGNDAVIHKIYKEIYPKIERFILTNKGDQADALDVFHDALMSIIVAQKKNRKPIQSFEDYLFVVCKNLWLRTLKKRVIKVESSTLEDKEQELSLGILEQEHFDFYIEKFHLISDNCKEILSSYFNGLSYEELMVEYAYSTVNTVRQRVFKCRTKLIQLIKGDKYYKKMKHAYQNR